MARTKAAYACTDCGWTTTKWVGQCPACKAWGTVEEEASVATSVRAVTALAPSRPAQPIDEVKAEDARARTTGLSELDRVLGGGIVPGAVILLAGEPGVGKSTLLLHVAARAAQKASRTGAGPVLYLTGEESEAQVRIRADRIGAVSSNLLLSSLTDVGAALGHIEQTRPSMVIVDSVQTFASADISGVPGSVTQVRNTAGAFIEVAKTQGVPIVLVGHVTKDGSIAGPRVLEHLVDVVCQFEGERHSRLRMLRALKNRYGATDEVGCFDLTDAGIIELPDPSGLFLEGADVHVPGTCATITLEGRRPMPLQVQSLLAETTFSSPRRTTSGLSQSRTMMTLAVLQARLRLPLGNFDIYVSTVGGAATSEPAVDLAIATSVAGAALDKTFRPGFIALGEVGLTGQLRSIVGIDRRLNEAARLGFTDSIVPKQAAGHAKVPAGMSLHPVDSVSAALRVGLDMDA
ncbi:DNA repair protein RadA/Sms [Bowdeniella nasicola]|uniref:DNA repair protein RadA n=1 Tax=Bowdeniella nasicola TaxID=208480 RepID=A0A1H3X7P6_9ACTO|nr:DNA repair protein RadA [Bowdeniella nasicola]SDZ95406.1 DNA repair protein RadA/Sms [Bowdeniella nasicola]